MVYIVPLKAFKGQTGRQTAHTHTHTRTHTHTTHRRGLRIESGHSVVMKCIVTTHTHEHTHFNFPQAFARNKVCGWRRVE